MAKSDKRIEKKLAHLEVIAKSDLTDAGKKELADALNATSNRVVAYVAKISAERLFYDFIPELIAAYQRLLHEPVRRDKGCFGKKAIIKALYELDHLDEGFYLDALRYRQHEPVWGGSVDTAIDIRCTAALGLVATSYPRAVIDLLELLHDSEPPARIGAVKAIARLERFQAEIALRAKVLHGDDEALVIGECLSELLSIEPEWSQSFVAERLHDPNSEIREMAALAIGESRLKDAVQLLAKCLEQEITDHEFRSVLCRAMALQALHKRDDALSYLVKIITHGHLDDAIVVVDALSICRHMLHCREVVEDAVRQRKAVEVQQAFEAFWRADKA